MSDLENKNIIEYICDLAKSNHDPYEYGVQVIELLFENKLISAETKFNIINSE